MHSIYARANNASAFLSTCVMVLLAAIAISSFVFDPQPTGHLSISKIKVASANAKRFRNRKQEIAVVNFNLTADLKPLFNWNTKQLFLSLEAEYIDTKGMRNDVVIWDRIVRRKEDADISVIGKNKYVFRDPSNTFKQVISVTHTPGIESANYTLKYNVMPYVGLLTYGEAARTEPVAFPKVQSR